ncbi:MAG: hypothetical protein AMXMBFR84_32260 [Candidatus Hydrogenedentota bacterium]
MGLFFLGKPGAHWPMPDLDVEAEVAAYQSMFKLDAAYADIEFIGNRFVSDVAGVTELLAQMKSVDGILVVHISMGIRDMLAEILKFGKPTIVFAEPYSGHEWNTFGRLMAQPEGALLDCVLSSDRQAIDRSMRAFRAIHHMREAKVLNVTSRELSADYCAAARAKFGTEIVRISREEVLAAYDATNGQTVEELAQLVIAQAAAVVEPSRDEIVRSCKLALAFQDLVSAHQATAITVDCYGTMYRQLPAFPCIGFTRINDMGLAGICESDLSSALTFMILQSISGRPGFISDPTMDESSNSIVLAHCLGSTKMQGPNGPACPYKIRSIMEREEGAVMQVKMDEGQAVTQAILVGADKLLYFTGKVTGTPDVERGCRTKIVAQVDGDAKVLWRNWTAGLHRVTCYGDLSEDLIRFCRFKQISITNEAADSAQA